MHIYFQASCFILYPILWINYNVSFIFFVILYILVQRWWFRRKKLVCLHHPWWVCFLWLSSFVISSFLFLINLHLPLCSFLGTSVCSESQLCGCVFGQNVDGKAAQGSEILWSCLLDQLWLCVSEYFLFLLLDWCCLNARRPLENHVQVWTKLPYRRLWEKSQRKVCN